MNGEPEMDNKSCFDDDSSSSFPENKPTSRGKCDESSNERAVNADKSSKSSGNSHINSANDDSGLHETSVSVIASKINETEGFVESLPHALDNGVDAALENNTERGEDQKNKDPVTLLNQQNVGTSSVNSDPVSGLGEHRNHNDALRQQDNRYNKNDTTSQEAQMVVEVPPHSRQTIYYQIPEIPSVVTLPVNNIPKNNFGTTKRQQQQQVQHHQEQQHRQHQHQQQQVQYSNQSEIHAGDQIIGMVGAIPIIKLQGGGMHYVKEKKGRFNLLQDAPIIPNDTISTTTPCPGPGVAGENQIQNLTLVGLPQNINTAAVNSNVSSSRSQSPMPTNNNTLHNVPQTFDGKSAPTAKRKGRFFVTNVKDPGSIIQNLHIQAEADQQVSAVTVVQSSDSEMGLRHQHFYHQQQSQQLSAPKNQSTTIQQNTQGPNLPQLPIQPVAIKPVITVQQTYEILQHDQPNYTQIPMHISQDLPHQFSHAQIQNNQPFLASGNVQFSHIPVESHNQNQQQYVQYLPQVQNSADPSTQSTYLVTVPVPDASISQVNELQQPQLPLQQDFQQRQLPVQQLPLSNNQHPISQTSSISTQPLTSRELTLKNTALSSNIPSSLHSRSVSLNLPLPNATIPKPPLQQQQKAVSNMRPMVQARSGKVPQTIGSNGALSPAGLGKIFYLLDQMKTEMTEADQSIKNFQTDMKLLRDKNKDLEAKNRELDKKLRDEQALREKVEIRNLDLRKKLRDAKVETMKPVKRIGKNSKEEIDANSIHEKSRSESVSNTEVLANEKQPNTNNDSSSQLQHKMKSFPNNQSHITPKERIESKNVSDAASRQNQNKAHGDETEGRNRVSTVESSIIPSSFKEKSPISQTTQATALTLIPPLRPSKNVSKMSGHQHSQSLHDFDPLKSTVPPISFPASLSLETMPVKSRSTPGSMNLTSEIGNAYLSQDPFLVLGMTPTTIQASEGAVDHYPSPIIGRQTVLSNGIHVLQQQQQQQQFMVVPQQEPIMLNHGMQQRIDTKVNDEWMNTHSQQQFRNNLQQSQFHGVSLQQQHCKLQQNQLQKHNLQQQSHQHAAQNQIHQNTANSFDPFPCPPK